MGNQNYAVAETAMAKDAGRLLPFVSLVFGGYEFKSVFHWNSRPHDEP